MLSEMHIIFFSHKEHSYIFLDKNQTRKNLQFSAINYSCHRSMFYAVIYWQKHGAILKHGCTLTFGNVNCWIFMVILSSQSNIGLGRYSLYRYTIDTEINRYISIRSSCCTNTSWSIILLEHYYLFDSLYRSTQNIQLIVEIQKYYFWNLKSCTCVSYRIRIVSAADRIVPALDKNNSIKYYVAR